MTLKPSALELRDEHLRPLRQFLVGNPDGLDPFERDPGNPDVRAERLLIVTAAVAAVLRRFGASFTRAEIIRFVADLRKSPASNTRDIDPRAIEDMIHAALGYAHPEYLVRVQQNPEDQLLASLLVLEKLRDQNVIPTDDMDEFIHETMAFAQQMLGAQPTLADLNLTR